MLLMSSLRQRFIQILQLYSKKSYIYKKILPDQTVIKYDRKGNESYIWTQKL
jgi:hypothetical protein